MNVRTIAYSIKVTMPNSLYKSLSLVDRVTKLIEMSEFIGVHPSADASYLLFNSENGARKSLKTLKVNGVSASYAGTCTYDSKNCTPITEKTKAPFEEDFDEFKRFKDLERKSDSFEKEKAELNRKIGDITAELKARESELKSKKDQVSELIEWNRKAIEEKNKVISKLERKVLELERELKESKEG